MKICLLGATGRVGSIILKNALETGHHVHALARKPFDETKMKFDSNLKWIIGNALNETDIESVIADTDIIISALNTDGNSTLSKSMPLIIRAMNKHSVKRIITIGTAGILQAQSEPELYRFQSKESRNKSTKAAQDHLQAYLELKKSYLDWTIVCPTYLPDGERTGKYRFEKDFLPSNGLSISTYDTGDFAFKMAFSKDFIHSRVGLAY